MTIAITPTNLETWVRGIRHAEAVRFALPLTIACDEFEINTRERLAAFIGQIAHESGLFRINEECLNYTAERLTKVWPSRFPTLALAESCAHNPIRLANKVYSGRMGNGSEETGDGWKYRGRGLIQITGRDNYRQCGEALRVNLLDNPDSLFTPELSARAAGWYWWKVGANRMADSGDLDAISDMINLGHRTSRVGDAIGYSDRVALSQYALKEMVA